jgi:SWI/SNF-related matrix-associated actin-dependent regulator of chromatin subfamily A member 5
MSMCTEYERQIKKIEDAEARREKDERHSALIKKKVSGVAYPLQLLKIQYANQTKGKSYSDAEDRFLLVQLAKYGVGKEDTYDKIKRDIAEFPAFRFDWFIKSRTPTEIARRCTTLVALVDKEEEHEEEGKKKGTNGAAATKGKRKVDEMSNTSRASTPAVATGSKKSRK